jgi:hypothetical protein
VNTLAFASETIAKFPTNLPRVAIAVELSADRKLTVDYRHRPISATHATHETCSTQCPFFAGGCYALRGHQGMVSKKLNDMARGMGNFDPLIAARAEAAAIRKLRGRYPLRLHVVGDCNSDAAARIVSAAADEHSAIADMPSWTYTHSWRTVARISWGGVSVLASCETDADVALATERGYAAAVVRPHEGLARTIAGLRTVPCPQQIGTKPDCASCLMCTKAHLLFGKAVIVFDPHGDVTKVTAALAGRMN